MIESMLEPHLKREAGATQADVGVTFLILGGVYMFSSPIGGLVSLGVINRLRRRMIIDHKKTSHYSH